jgi:hypothetical protein
LRDRRNVGCLAVLEKQSFKNANIG